MNDGGAAGFSTSSVFTRKGVVKCLATAGSVMLSPLGTPLAAPELLHGGASASSVNIYRDAAEGLPTINDEATAIAATEQILQITPSPPDREMANEMWVDIVKTAFQAAVKRPPKKDDLMVQMLMSTMESKDKFSTRNQVDVTQLFMQQIYKTGGDPYESIRLQLLGHGPDNNEALVNGLKGLKTYYEKIIKLNHLIKTAKSSKSRRKYRTEAEFMKRYLTTMFTTVRNSARAIASATGHISVRQDIRDKLRIAQGIQTLGWNLMQEPSGVPLLAVDATEAGPAHVTVQIPIFRPDNVLVVRRAMHVESGTDKLSFRDGVLEVNDGEAPLELGEENFAKIAEGLRKAQQNEMFMRMLAGEKGPDVNAMIAGMIGGGSDTQAVLSALQKHPDKVLNALSAREPDMMAKFRDNMLAKFQQKMDPKMSMMLQMMGTDLMEKKVDSVWEILTGSNSAKITSRIKAISGESPPSWRTRMTNNRANLNSVRVTVRPTSVGHEFTGYLLCRSAAQAASVAAKLDRNCSGSFASVVGM